MEIQLRHWKESDSDFLIAMLLEAAFPPSHPKPSIAQAKQDPRLKVWIDGFGSRHGDLSLIATDADGSKIGAVWCRLFSEEPVVGFLGIVSPEIPVLGIGVVPEFRGKGVGQLLIDGMKALLSDVGVSSLSLCVGKSNPAVRLYERCGFTVVTEHGSQLVMKLGLRPTFLSRHSNN